MKTKSEVLHEELQLVQNAKKVQMVQAKVNRKYAFLKTVSKAHFQYEYALAQAVKICQIELELRLSPFPSLYSTFLTSLTSNDFLYANYIKVNKYGLIQPDYPRLKKLLPATNIKTAFSK